MTHSQRGNPGASDLERSVISCCSSFGLAFVSMVQLQATLVPAEFVSASC